MFQMLGRDSVLLFSVCVVLTVVINDNTTSHGFVLAATTSSLNVPVEQLYRDAQFLKKNHQWLEAKEVYEKLIRLNPDFANKKSLSKEIGDINLKMIEYGQEDKESFLYVVKKGDTLGKIARRFECTVKLIQRRNHLKGDLIYPGQKLNLWRGKFTVLVDKSENKLILNKNNKIVKEYSVSTGKHGSTPVGEFKIKTKMIDPVWFHRGEVIPPGTPENFLGTRWLGFDKPAYGIHGTVEPHLIGQSVSSGCVRMRNSDVEELFDFLPEGTRVVIEE